jgi:copper(I)-binding protein
MHRHLTFTVGLLAAQAMQILPVLSAELPIVVEAAWVREGPPVAKMLAGYMVLKNGSESSVSVRAARSDDFDRVEFHRSMIVDGVARMTQETRVEIPARGQIDFEPGGWHLMLIGPAKALESGDAITLTLVLEDGREIEIAAPVRRSPPE